MKPIVIISLILSLSILGCKQGTKIATIGDNAPGFTLSDIDGNKVSLNDLLKGKEVILNFWASWCPECRKETTVLNEIAKKYKDKIDIVGINLKESKENVQSFVGSKGIGYKMLLDTKGKIARQYGVISLPVNVLINKEGLVKNLNIDIQQVESYLRTEPSL